MNLKNTGIPALPEEVIETKIFDIRGRKVMLDRDIAALYGVNTKALNQAVKRNMKRFPSEFMFRLSEEEFNSLRSQIVTLEGRGKYPKYLPQVFTEHGVSMLASVLNSERAIQVSVQIIYAFIRQRQMLLTHADLKRKIEQLENKYQDHDQLFKEVFFAIKKLTAPPAKPKKEIGFHTGMRDN